MYYRRKIILSLLSLKPGPVSKIDLQKLLFIFTKYPKANADLKTMIKYDLVSADDKKWTLEDTSTNYFDQLKEEDKKTLTAMMKHHGQKSTSDLIKFTYRSFPYWATKSTVAEKYLSSEELAKVESYKTPSTEKALYTIGYEGIPLEAYLNKLIKHDIKLLLDVRKNAKSMKYGFSKNQLSNACDGIGIEYRHMPEVGIESDKRTELNEQSDYDALFEDYKSTTLSSTISYQQEIAALVHNYERIALTCFEENICQCHRKPLAESIVSHDTSLLIHHI